MPNGTLNQAPNGMLGQIENGRNLGLKSGVYRIWAACVNCGKERWTEIINGKPRPRCRCCKGRGSDNPNWKGGVTYQGGYKRIQLQPDDFFNSMANKKGIVYEHRLVVAKALGRCLHLWEVVHHKRGYAKDDNRYPETLQLVTDDRHKQITILENRIGRLEDKVKEQTKLIKLLQWQIKEIKKMEAKQL